MNLSKIRNIKARKFLSSYFNFRQINRDFFEKVTEKDFDFRVVSGKSDSVKESLIHQISTQRCYIDGIKSGKLFFGKIYQDLKDKKFLSKNRLISLLENEDTILIKLLSDEKICRKPVKVPWMKSPITAVESLNGLKNHEILHNGWNLALMDHLKISRFESLKKMWGDL